MLIGILGCNLAWGIIDGVLYVLGSVFERGRLRRVGFGVRAAASPEEARALVASELDPVLEAVTDPAQRSQLYGSIALRLKESGPGLERDPQGRPARGACQWLARVPVQFSGGPAVPAIRRTDVRLRVSNGILLALLFLVGYRHARHTHGPALADGAGVHAGRRRPGGARDPARRLARQGLPAIFARGRCPSGGGTQSRNWRHSKNARIRRSAGSASACPAAVVGPTSSRTDSSNSP